MIPGRGTQTDQILNVIEVIQMGKKSGLLTIERDEHGTLEQGELTFVRGQITQARCGLLTGQQALNWLSAWQRCRFLFSPTSLDSGMSSDTSTRFPSQAHVTTQDRRTSGNLPTPAFASNPPRRIRPDHEAMQVLQIHGLSRLHRHLFLLINGQRDTQELIRLMGRPATEVQRLLQDLERIHLIQR
jgi:hypothetical protein